MSRLRLTGATGTRFGWSWWGGLPSTPIACHVSLASSLVTGRLRPTHPVGSYMSPLLAFDGEQGHPFGSRIGEHLLVDPWGGGRTRPTISYVLPHLTVIVWRLKWGAPGPTVKRKAVRNLNQIISAPGTLACAPFGLSLTGAM